MCHIVIEFTDNFHLILIVNGYTIKLMHNCRGNDLSNNIRMRTPTECGKTCDQLTACIAFVFTGESCFLKHKCLDLHDDKNRCVYLKIQGSFTSCITFFIIVHNTVFLFRDLTDSFEPCETQLFLSASCLKGSGC